MASPSIHYVGAGKVAPEGDHARCENLWQNIINQHRSTYGPNSAYNFAACNAHGIRFEGRGWNRDSAANGQQGGVNYNPGSRALIALIGDEDDPSAELERAVAEFANEAFARGFPRPLKGHRDFVATGCPGDALMEWIARFNAGTAIDWAAIVAYLEATDMTPDQDARLRNVENGLAGVINQFGPQGSIADVKGRIDRLDKKLDELLAKP